MVASDFMEVCPASWAVHGGFRSCMVLLYMVPLDPLCYVRPECVLYNKLIDKDWPDWLIYWVNICSTLICNAFQSPIFN